MSCEPHTAAIAHRLRSILEQGVEISPEAMRFIGSTFGDPSAAELDALLHAESNSEGDSLVDLLLSPDEAVQLDIEECLDPLEAFETDADELVELLGCPPLSVDFRLPEDRGAIHILMTPDHIRRFLRRLRFSRMIPAPLAAAVEARLNGGDRLRLRVLLRGARFDFNPSFDDFLGRLIDRLDWDNPNGWEAFAFALELLAGTDAGADIWRSLAQWKQLLHNGLNRGRRQGEAVAVANIETLFSRGQRLTYVDEVSMQRQLACIDRLCLAAFGRIVHLDPGPPDEVLALDGPPDIADMIRRLS